MPRVYETPATNIIKERWEEIKMWLDLGLSVNKSAKKLGIDEKTLRTYIKKNGA